MTKILSLNTTVYLVDAFTTEVGKGNRAGVVLDADGLSDREMQYIAHVVNVSETAFVLSASDHSHDVRVRYFTPTSEVPICGHATIATHFLRANVLKLGDVKGLRCQTGAGVLPVDISKNGDDYSVVMTQGKIVLEDPLSGNVQKKLLSALGICANDLDSSLPVQVVSTGHSKVMIPLLRKDVLDRLSPNLDTLKHLSGEIGHKGFFVFTLDSPDPDYMLYGRMFAPAIGIDEDPVTGNANGPVGAYLLHYGKLITTDSDPIVYRAIQGQAMGKPGCVEVLVWSRDVPVKIQIRGSAVIAGAMEVSPRD
jgi:PhzF family phenazine biosynthesis protein